MCERALDRHTESLKICNGRRRWRTVGVRVVFVFVISIGMSSLVCVAFFPHSLSRSLARLLFLWSFLHLMIIKKKKSKSRRERERERDTSFITLLLPSKVPRADCFFFPRHNSKNNNTSDDSSSSFRVSCNIFLPFTTHGDWVRSSETGSLDGIFLLLFPSLDAQSVIKK